MQGPQTAPNRVPESRPPATLPSGVSAAVLDPENVAQKLAAAIAVSRLSRTILRRGLNETFPFSGDSGIRESSEALPPTNWRLYNQHRSRSVPVYAIKR